MDQTNRYVNMCEKAVRVQETWNPQVGDWVWRKYTLFSEESSSNALSDGKDIEIIILHFKSSVEGYWAAVNEHGEERIFKSPEDLILATSIWLPRQDQLQARLDFGGNPDWWPKLNGLQKFAGNLWPKNGDHPFRSFEQLWLAYVMEECYELIWNGEDWE